MSRYSRRPATRKKPVRGGANNPMLKYHMWLAWRRAYALQSWNACTSLLSVLGVSGAGYEKGFAAGRYDALKRDF